MEQVSSSNNSVVTSTETNGYEYEHTILHRYKKDGGQYETKYVIKITSSDDYVAGKYYFIIGDIDLWLVISTEEQYAEVVNFFSRLMVEIVQKKHISKTCVLLGANVEVVDNVEIVGGEIVDCGDLGIYIECGCVRTSCILSKEILPTIVGHLIQRNPYVLVELLDNQGRREHVQDSVVV